MKKQLLAGAALLAVFPGLAMAADLGRPRPAPAPVYTKAPPPLTLYSWTGCYVGGNGGGLFAHKDFTTLGGLAVGGEDINGGLVGAQVGCNYQFSSWVIGAQGDWDWSGAKDSFTDIFADVDTVKIKSLASVTGRLGYAWDRFLIYGKGGGAWESDDYTATFGALSSAASQTRSGWTAGGGGEYAFTDWLTGFVEYDHYDFGNKAVTLVGTLGTFTLNAKERKDVVKAGLNIKFGWGGPVVARY